MAGDIFGAIAAQVVGGMLGGKPEAPTYQIAPPPPPPPPAPAPAPIPVAPAPALTDASGADANQTLDAAAAKNRALKRRAAAYTPDATLLNSSSGTGGSKTLLGS